VARAVFEFETVKNWDLKDGQLTVEGSVPRKQSAGEGGVVSQDRGVMNGGVQWIGLLLASPGIQFNAFQNMVLRGNRTSSKRKGFQVCEMAMGPSSCRAAVHAGYRVSNVCRKEGMGEQRDLKAAICAVTNSKCTGKLLKIMS